MTEALKLLEQVAAEIYTQWDQDMRSGKLLLALWGQNPNYDPRVTAIRAALNEAGSQVAEEAYVLASQSPSVAGFQLHGLFCCRQDARAHVEKDTPGFDIPLWERSSEAIQHLSVGGVYWTLTRFATPPASNDAGEVEIDAFTLYPDCVRLAVGPFDYEFISARKDPSTRWRIHDSQDDAVGHAATPEGARAALVALYTREPSQ